VIAYFDTSAFVPLVIAEQGSGRARALWDAADRVTSARLIYPEARAALAHAHRIGRLTNAQLRRAVSGVDELYDQLDIVELDDALARKSGALAETHGLRGYDAVHLAAAETLRDPDLVLVAGDGALLAAGATTGLATAVVH
jgi:predicted nucleic acid-binding protein